MEDVCRLFSSAGRRPRCGSQHASDPVEPAVRSRPLSAGSGDGRQSPRCSPCASRVALPVDRRVILDNANPAPLSTAVARVRTSGPVPVNITGRALRDDGRSATRPEPLLCYQSRWGFLNRCRMWAANLGPHRGDVRAAPDAGVLVHRSSRLEILSSPRRLSPAPTVERQAVASASGSRDRVAT